MSKSEKEGFILKEDTFEEAQDHMVLSGGPQCCGSQEFWFGKTCEEEKSRLRRWPAYPSRESVENTTCDITEVIVKDEMISVEEHLKDADVYTHLVPQKGLHEQVFYIYEECGKCFDQNEEFDQHQRIHMGRKSVDVRNAGRLSVSVTLHCTSDDSHWGETLRMSRMC